jgi:hypothetical protein
VAGLCQAKKPTHNPLKTHSKPTQNPLKTLKAHSQNPLLLPALVNKKCEGPSNYQ